MPALRDHVVPPRGAWLVAADGLTTWRVAWTARSLLATRELVVVVEEFTRACPFARVERLPLSEWVTMLGAGCTLSEGDARNLIAAWLETGGLDV